MKSTINLIIAVMLIGSVTITGISCVANTRANQPDNLITTSPEADMSGWSDVSKMAVMMMKEQYGEPTSVTSEMMMWENTGQWKRTVVYAQEHEHNFPIAHTDVMQQWIDYEVPTEKFSELAEYDGSVVVNRTNGEISARCDLEGANFLAINIAHDLIEGTEDVQGARDLYAKTIKDMINGDKPAYMQRLQFDVADGNTAFTDEPHSSITSADLMKMKEMKKSMEKELMAKVEANNRNRKSQINQQKN